MNAKSLFYTILTGTMVFVVRGNDVTAAHEILAHETMLKLIYLQMLSRDPEKAKIVEEVMNGIAEKSAAMGEEKIAEIYRRLVEVPDPQAPFPFQVIDGGKIE
jgi:hypothetical protein